MALACVVAGVSALGTMAPALAGTVHTDLRLEGGTAGVEVDYTLYLPDGYGDDGDRYPTLYLLHGYGGDHQDWLELGEIEVALDRLIGDDEIQPLIVVMPAGGNSWYVDSAARGGPGNYASAIAQDLVDHIDATLATIDDARGRAVAGLSMGGFGALRLALGNPDRFGAVVALSPAIFKPDGASWAYWSLGDTADERAYWFQGAFGAPFDMQTYLAEQPFTLIERMDVGATAPRILLTSGDDDELDFHFGTVEMFMALRDQGVGVELRIGDGGHDWSYWQATSEAMLRFLDQGWPATATSP